MASLNDPLAHYLREIGQVPLLTHAQDLWLATQINAARIIARLREQTLDAGQGSVGTTALLAAWQELGKRWDSVLDLCKQLNCQPASLHLLVAEAQELRRTWQSDGPSTLSAWFDSVKRSEGPWVRIARNVYEVFTLLYLLPPQMLDRIDSALRSTQPVESLAIRLPEAGIFEEGLPSEREIEENFNAIGRRADDAGSALVRCNMRLVVSAARQSARQDASFFTLIQDGNIGLGRAVETYDPTRAIKFSTHAVGPIRKTMDGPAPRP